MDISYFIDTIKFQLTGGVLQSELPDESYKRVVDLGIQELNRFYDSTQLIQVDGNQRCIDLAELEEKNNIQINYVANIYRTKPNGSSSNGAVSDPVYLSQWSLGGNTHGFGSPNWMYRYAAYNTVTQIANTMSTDLDFKEDKIGRKLYVNYSTGSPSELTIEYVPRITAVEQIKSDYWIDILLKISLAYAKITLGRIRTRYTQSDALWTQDGDKLLTEGTEELKTIIDRLQTYSNFSYPLD